MADGFEVVPEELERAAASIGEAVRDAAGMVWGKPSGDYGHPALDIAWGQFLDDVKDHVDTIYADALGHGLHLKDAANHYRDADTANGRVVGNCWLPNGHF